MYVKVKAGRAWLIARPAIGEFDSYREVARCASEAECNALLADLRMGAIYAGIHQVDVASNADAA